MKTERSHELFSRAQELMPGGVNSPARAFGGVGGEPIVFERAQGAYLYDVDGNRYIDYIGSWGPMILGHRHPEVVAAIERALAHGTSYGAPTEAESELAERIIDAVESIEMVRLVSSGTEATMSAVRRGFRVTMAVAKGGLPPRYSVSASFRRPIFWDETVEVLRRGQELAVVGADSRQRSSGVFEAIASTSRSCRSRPRPTR